MNPNNDFALPEFTTPATIREARDRIRELEVAIESINDQEKYREMEGTLDGVWYKRASTSRRFKTLEKKRLEDWISDFQAMGKNGVDLNEIIVSVVRGDYEDAEWEAVMREVREIADMKNSNVEA
jgi:hypothetical protein